MEQDKSWTTDQAIRTNILGFATTGSYSARMDETLWVEPGHASIISDHFLVEWVSFSDLDLQSSLPGTGYAPVGRLQLLPPGVDLRCRWSGPGRTRTVSCMFLEQAMAELEDVSSGFATLDHEKIVDLSNPFIEAAMLKLAEEVCSPGLDSDFMVRSLIGSICVEIRRVLLTSTAGSLDGAGLTDRQLARLKDVLHNTEGKLPSLESLALECGVAPRDLASMVKSATGLTLRRYVALERMNRAKSMLRQDQLPIKQVAHSCGFTTAAAFTAAFRKTTGVTPGSYRAH